jgi:fructose-bisphosphate aldolase class II
VSLVGLGPLLADARSAGYGLLAGNVILVEHAEALVAAGETVQAPIVLQVSENAVRYHGALSPIGLACRSLAESAGVPVGLHLDHATERSLCEAAANIGFGSVMFDASRLPDDENAARTADVVTWAHDRGLIVEAEIGVVAGKDGRNGPAAPTKPDDARRFVERTGVDALAVQVGSTHGRATRSGSLDLDRITRIREVVSVPLVLHGSSGITDEQLAAGVQRGLVKINVGTRLNVAFTDAIRDRLADDPSVVDPRRYLEVARSKMTAVTVELLRILGATGQARAGF